MFNQDIVKDLLSPIQISTYLNENEEKNFDSREKWPDAIKPLKHQENCSACWAIAGASVLSDRFRISKCDIGELSPQDLLSCDKLDHGCYGGTPLHVWSWLSTKGIATEECFPYVSGNGTVPECSNKCQDKKKAVRYKARSAAIIPPQFIISDLMANGPQEAAFLVFDDFLRYSKGVYKHKKGELLGAHSVKLIGFGIEKGTKYWLMANSWGEEWGEGGFFKIRRGKNECGVESMVFAGTPQCD
ncbi:putative cathepsin B5 cysteine protease [Monocercomonoides exilis]|uniref:putative cathepsin B5 cysteine protease n=1 Tax=Monocercomonoides exilis TaxID=2049356 RepID=UPI00355AA2E1|nr:putative cathepsin B5 cysteine protease [Monocercomonoides exilis]|eukprot:MONOS_6815.1-p1 / transcript=MONOS_6815.1 / gene=MONOS_6815 / organism=Monocercomonoides_exilis_PA203 / gene_product=cathepsin B5 cysteine protease / transcript_product=cathepsin B5 cysteine protease / location=Mono_scaffold00222:17448-18179(+) / protein_length=243 / sequence_SO=supercontig / SO=protein_coding / is_pseudo=false